MSPISTPCRRLCLGVGFMVFCFLFSIAAPLMGQTDLSAKIASIKVAGNKNVSALLIYGHLIEKEGDDFSLRRVRMDIHNLFNMGDFTDVQADVEQAVKTGQVVLTFQVKERPQISKIIFIGQKKWGPSKFLQEIKSSPKETFDPAKLNGDVTAIKKLYLDEGYSNVNVSVKSKVDTEANTAEVTFYISEGRKVKVAKVTVTGAEAFSEKKVAEQMKNNHSGDNFKPDLLDEDIKKIEDFYHDEGYLKAAVLSHQETLSPTRRKVFITLKVKEGDKYTFAGVEYHGNVLFDDEDLSKALGLKKNEVLSKSSLDDGTRKMKTLYADKGYIYSVVKPTLNYDEELKKVSLVFDISEGEIAYVQDIKIVGNYKTADYVIRRELMINAGDKFEANLIRGSAQNLYNLGYFDEVNPEVEPGDTPGKEILVFRVKERKTGTISVGGGYSSVDGLVGTVKLDEANLLGHGLHGSINVQFGASQTSFDIGFSEPWLFNTRTSFGIDVFDTDRIYTTAVPNPYDNSTNFYTEKRYGGSLSLGRKLSRYWNVFGTYLFENVDIGSVDPYYTTPGTPQYIQSSDLTTSSFTPRVVFDNRDNYFDPTTGWKHQLSVEFAGGPLGADTNFIKVIGDTSHFIPLVAGFVLGEHVRAGAGQGYWFPGRGFTDVPLYEKFFAGGTDTIRGYNERSVGPVAGGDALFVSNTELKHAIVGPLRGVLFFDAGDAWTTVLNLDESHVQFGAGLGLRLTIPGTVMAIRLDYGWAIDSDLSTSAAPHAGVLHFNLGDLF